ncbi:MAG: hypothetical protein M3N68_04435 [Actinomycetota bacterium]|nr:hypothetical protein [Actinomycetota bacterium]
MIWRPIGALALRGRRGRSKAKGSPKLGLVLQVAGLGLAVAAVVKELRTPPDERRWHGTVAGVVPYDFRLPTLARVRSTVWNPEADRLLGPPVFGVGWTLNVGRLLKTLRS